MNEGSGLKRLIDIKAAATYTGLSVHTVYAMVSQRHPLREGGAATNV